MAMAQRWPDHVDDVLAGDLGVMLAYVTPARGVVLTPVVTLGLRDRERGTATTTTSVALWRKLERIRSNPQVALVYHSRTHGFSDRSEYVLAQGRGAFPDRPDPQWLESIRSHQERFLGPRDSNPLMDWWMRVYTWERVGIEIAMERMVVWPDLECSGQAEVLGAALPADPEPQKPPSGGTAPRIDHERAARLTRRLPHVLLGWVGGDGFPVVVPVTAEGTSAEGILLRAPEGLIPPGGRRAGLTAHSFAPQVTGQEQRIHTGWLEAAGSRLVYAPHTKAGYRMPASKLLFKLAAGGATRRGIREARRRGLTAG